MKSILCAAALAAVVAAPCLAQAQTAPAQAPAAVQWKLATGYRAESFHTENLQAFAQDVRQATAGRLQIEIHPNNSLHKLAEIRQAVQDGQVQAGETILSS